LCPYVLDARLGLWISLEHAFMCAYTTNQAEQRSNAAHLLARQGHERATALWSRALEAVHLLSLQPHSLQAQAPLNLSVTACPNI